MISRPKSSGLAALRALVVGASPGTKTVVVLGKSQLCRWTERGSPYEGVPVGIVEVVVLVLAGLLADRTI